ncbi:MAG: ATP phosphoribosyltransferase [bacterium]
MPRIALPNKGRLADDTRELFTDAGLDVRTRDTRALSASLGGLFDAIFVRASDIPEFVADGAADLGVTGWDLVGESERDVVSLLDLELGRCRLSIAATDDSGINCVEDLPPGVRVATAFPRLTSRYFANTKHVVAIVPVSGAAEIAPHLGIADVIVDLVSTGSTLRVNGLREVATVLESSARLIASRATFKMLNDATAGSREIRGLVSALESVIRAKAQRYVMANIRREQLAEVRRILPGLGGPTVIDVLNGGDHVAVHAVVPASAIYQTIGDLRAIGATGVLVTRIERLVP